MRQTLLAFFALVLAGGCDPGEFGAALDQAPVQVIGDPGGFGSDVGRVLLPLAPLPNMAARLLFAGSHPNQGVSLAVASFDRDGKSQVQAATSDDPNTLGLTFSQNSAENGISSMAALNGSTTEVLIALGIPNLVSAQGQGAVAFVKLAADANGNADFESAAELPRFAPAEPHFGLAVAAGRVTQTAADELIVVSDEGVHALGFPTSDVVSDAKCAVSMATPADLYRSLAVADFLPDSDSGGRQEIAVGLPNPGLTGAGRVLILQYDAVAADLSCPIELSVPSDNSPGFGTALAAVPHADGKSFDLLVGAPPDRVYLFASPFNGSPIQVFSGDATSQFGQRVAPARIGVGGAQEIAITALQADVGSTKAAGKVLIYALDGDGTTPVAALNDSSPINKEDFGIGLAELEFNNSSPICPKGKDAHLLVVGADLDIFTFFNFPHSAADPRCFAQK
jgi:hypothetical protein